MAKMFVMRNVYSTIGTVQLLFYDYRLARFLCLDLQPDHFYMNIAI